MKRTFFYPLISRFFIGCTLVLVACNDPWTAQADGYFILDGVRSNVHIASVDAFGSLPDLYFVGKGGYYVEMSLTTGSKNISEGTFPFEYFATSTPKKINSFRVRAGGDAQDFSGDANSTGSMTVKITGNSYNFEFTGNVKGHTLVVHYTGQIVVQ